MYSNKILTIFALLFFSLSIVSCVDKTAIQSDQQIRNIYQQSKEKSMNKDYSYSYELIQKKRNLIFTMKLKNITNENLKVRLGSRFIKVFHDGKEIVTSITFPSYIERPNEVYAEIKSNEVYQYQFTINKEFNLLEGEKKYTLEYLSEIFDIPDSGDFDPKYRKSIEFVWKKDKEGDGGELVNVVYFE